MELNAIAVANYFVKLANNGEEENTLKLLGLVKRVYITHGFSLALLDRGILDPKFDVVEAWKFGPVIPSVYHSFKHNRKEVITKKAVISHFVNNEIEYYEPELKDTQIIEVAEGVWEKYKDYTDSQLVTLLHNKGTPWEYCYKIKENEKILDSMTKYYYQSLIQQ